MKKKNCVFCGKIIDADAAFLCNDCNNNSSYTKQKIEAMQAHLIKTMNVNPAEAMQMALENLKDMPVWQKNREILEKKYIIITDIGSTTTKAILLVKENDSYVLHKEMAAAATSVEKPNENVMIGVFEAIEKLAEQSGIELLTNGVLSEEVAYITTSSAGGGLQIVNIGLTLFDSAASGQRTVFGAGGVILDTFAIDDKRSALEQMTALKNLHPDIILMSGGVDEGAISTILRLGEILSIAEPRPKFGAAKVPLIFAGNIKARDFITSMFAQKFDLFITDNIRPEISRENLKPAREKIHALFMDKVMEQAPGYRQLLDIAADEVIPTPSGVIKSLQMLSENYEENIMAVDIGGATTDIFSNILGSYFRTVSANYGMSYSISNILADTGYDKIARWLPDEMNETDIRNYIANKTLYPTFNPQTSSHLAIEHACAKEALRLSKKHHLEMNFNTKQIGFLEKLKKNDMEKITEAFYFEREQEKKKFHIHDINIMIGAGGVISHTKSAAQAMMLVVDGLEPQGITEIWRDKKFISPHLGKLSAVDSQLAQKILMDSCYEKLSLHIKPITKKIKKNQAVFQISIDGVGQSIGQNELIYLEASKNRQIIIICEKNVFLKGEEKELRMTTDLAVLIDTRASIYPPSLDLHDDKTKSTIEASFTPSIVLPLLTETENIIRRELPHQGELLVELGASVSYDTEIGINKYDPPKIYVLTLYEKTHLKLSPDDFDARIQIKVGDIVNAGDIIISKPSRSGLLEFVELAGSFEAPVRGVVENINIETGTIIMREVQDYSSKPRVVQVAKRLGIAPKFIKGYTKRSVGEFVYAGEQLASNAKLDKRQTPVFITAPSTGTIKEINPETGTLTIKYDKEPHVLMAGVAGVVTCIEENLGIDIAYKAFYLSGVIGFGSENWGVLKYAKSIKDTVINAGEIVACPAHLTANDLKYLAGKKIKGLIIPSIHSKDMSEFLGKEMGVALTGNEGLDFTIIITSGFGNFEMDTKLAEFFAKKDGTRCYIDGHTQIRAGVIRPQIIIS